MKDERIVINMLNIFRFHSIAETYPFSCARPFRDVISRRSPCRKWPQQLLISWHGYGDWRNGPRCA